MPTFSTQNATHHDSIYYQDVVGNHYVRFKYATGKVYVSTMPNVEFITNHTILFCISWQTVHQDPVIGAYPFEVWPITGRRHRGHLVNHVNIALNANETQVINNLHQLQAGLMYEMNDVFNGTYNNGVVPTRQNQGGQPVVR